MLLTENNNKLNLAILLFVLIIGASLRLYGLNIQSLWTDELYTWLFASSETVFGVIDYSIEEDTYPPAYYLFMHFIIKYFGDSENVLRLPSAFAGIISIYAIYLLGKNIYGNREGVVAASLFSVLYVPIFISQEARTYSILIMFILFQTNYLISILKALKHKIKPSKLDILICVVLAIICSYLHYFGTYLVFLQGVGFALITIKYKLPKGYFFCLFFTTLLFFSPWLPVLFFHLPNTDWVDSARNLTIILFIKNIGYQLNAGKSFFTPLSSYTKLDFLISLFIGSIGFALLLLPLLRHLYSYYKDPKATIGWNLFFSRDIILYYWIAVPLIGTYLLSNFSIGSFNHRHFIIILPAVYLLLSRSITQKIKSQKSICYSVLGISVLAIFHLNYYMEYYSIPSKRQYREAVSYIADQYKLFPNSPIIIDFGERAAIYYLNKKNLGNEIAITDTSNNGHELLKNVDIKNAKHIWFISAYLPVVELIDKLSQDFILRENTKFKDIDILFFERVNS